MRQEGRPRNNWDRHFKVSVSRTAKRRVARNLRCHGSRRRRRRDTSSRKRNMTNNAGTSPFARTIHRQYRGNNMRDRVGRRYIRRVTRTRAPNGTPPLFNRFASTTYLTITIVLRIPCTSLSRYHRNFIDRTMGSERRRGGCKW